MSASLKTGKKLDGIEFPYWPQQKQKEAWKLMAPYSRTTVNGYGGPKFGGKSWNIRAICNTMLMDKPLTACIFGREYDALKDLHIEPIKAEMRDFIDAGKMKWNSNDKQFTFAETGSILRIQQVNRPKDIHKHNGKRFDIVCVDEAQNFTPFELKYFPGLAGPSPVAVAAREKVRLHIKAADNDEEYEYYKHLLERYYYLPKTLFCFNWGDAGHNYLVKRFWEGCNHPQSPNRDLSVFETEEYRDKETDEVKERYVEDPEEFAYVYADWKDNKIGYQENPQYIKTLKRYPEPYRTAYLKGDPYAFAGLKFQIVDPIHEVDIDKILEPHGGTIPEHWLLIGALDPGTFSPCTFSLYMKRPDGVSFQISDYYRDNMGFEKHAEQIHHHIRNGHHRKWTLGRLPRYVIAGHDAWHKKSRYSIHAHDATFADIFWNEYGIRLVKCNTDRVQGAMALANALEYDMDEDTGELTRKPSLYFGIHKTENKDGTFEKHHICKPTKEEIMNLKSDEKMKEDIERGPEIDDHAYDKTRYYLMGARTPVEKKDHSKDKYEHSDYGRIPKSKVYSEDKDEEPDMEDMMGVGDLEHTM